MSYRLSMSSLGRTCSFIVNTRGRLQCQGWLKTSFCKFHTLIDGQQNMTWSKHHFVRSQHNIGHHCSTNNVQDKNQSFNQWSEPFQMKAAEIDLDYLLSPENYSSIKENISNRKGIGDIDLVLELYKKVQTESDTAEKAKLQQLFERAALDIPNKTHPDVPVGDEKAAIQVDLVGKMPAPISPKTLFQLEQSLGMLRTRNMNTTMGNGTYFLVDQLAMLEHALVRYTIDNVLKSGFKLVSVPDLLQPQVIESCGFKTTGDVTQVYKLDPSRHENLCLAGTSEMALAGYFMNEVLKKEDLPVKVAAVSRCFRAETSHTLEETGIYRVHQFTKVEMFGVTANECGNESDDLLTEIVNMQKNLFAPLKLHFRVLDMPTTELGAPASRKFDMEAWMCGMGFWGEISSASNCTDYQTRRLNIKYMTDSGQLRHCHTVNGTACAVPRTIMAICEGRYKVDGSIHLPEVLSGYMNGMRKIQRNPNAPRMKRIKPLRD